MFAEKDERVTTKKFIIDMKKHYAEMLGNTVFDRKSPYLAQTKIGKGNPNKELIREHNRTIQQFNQFARSYQRIGGDEKKLYEYKKTYFGQPLHRRQNILMDILTDLRYRIKDLIDKELKRRIWGVSDPINDIIEKLTNDDLVSISDSVEPPKVPLEKFSIEPEKPAPEYERDQELEHNSENPDDDFEFR